MTLLLCPCGMNYLPNLTRYQWLYIFFISFVMLIDAAISINGAWNYNAIFYEANPVFSSFKTRETFTIAVITLKTVAIIITVWIISVLNKEPGIKWGDLAAKGALFTCALPIGVMMIMNFII